MRILVKRRGALGDVVLVTAVTRRLKREQPDAHIEVETQYPEVFAGLGVTAGKAAAGEFDRIIDLDMAHERHLRREHQVRHYMREAFGDPGDSTRVYINYDDPAPAVLAAFGLENQKFVALHPARSWPSRTLPEHFWLDLMRSLGDRGLRVVVVGTHQDRGLPGAIDTRSRLSLRDQASLINAAAVYVGSDNGLAVIAQATTVPVVELLTITAPENALFDRPPGAVTIPIIADIDCVGCLSRLDKVVTFMDCPRGDNACVGRFHPDYVAWQAMKVARKGDDHAPSQRSTEAMGLRQSEQEDRRRAGSGRICGG